MQNFAICGRMVRYSKITEGYRVNLGTEPADTEQTSWVQSIPALLENLDDSAFDNLQVIIELQMPVGAERADVVLFRLLSLPTPIAAIRPQPRLASCPHGSLGRPHPHKNGDGHSNTYTRGHGPLPGRFGLVPAESPKHRPPSFPDFLMRT